MKLMIMGVLVLLVLGVLGKLKGYLIIISIEFVENANWPIFLKHFFTSGLLCNLLWSIGSPLMNLAIIVNMIS